MARKKKNDLFKIALIFNDAFMRETGLDIDDNDHVYNMETDSALVIRDKFIKYRLKNCATKTPFVHFFEKFTTKGFLLRFFSFASIRPW